MQIQLLRQLLQFPIAFHLPEFLLRFEQPRGGPAGEVVAALPELIRHDLRRSIQNMERAVTRLRHEALLFIAADPQLARRSALLVSIPGIATTSALHLLAELLRFGPESTVRQWVAYAGLDARQHQSGTSVAKKPARSKTGSAHLRRALYMPALVAVQHDPHLGGFYQHLLERGKTKLQALVAVLRKSCMPSSVCSSTTRPTTVPKSIAPSHNRSPYAPELQLRTLQTRENLQRRRCRAKPRHYMCLD